MVKSVKTQRNVTAPGAVICKSKKNQVGIDLFLITAAESNQ